MTELLAIKYHRGKLELLDQRLLPFESKYIGIETPQQAYDAIKDMAVRGAPAIGCTAALAVAAWLDIQGNGNGTQFSSASEATQAIQDAVDLLVESRPTAVNLQDACRALSRAAHKAETDQRASSYAVVHSVVLAAEEYYQADIVTCQAIGRHGSQALLRAVESTGGNVRRHGKLRVLTHCNTGALATAAYGTALGVVRSLATNGKLEHAYCTETRPYNQGSRLTAYELVHEGLPSTLLADSAVAALMGLGQVDAVVVGADRIAANGDTANKIGTFSIAVCAAHHGIPFFIAAPLTTIDTETSDGSKIHIEQRDSSELTHMRGQRVAARGIEAWNPSFDVTPAALIKGIITEHGLVPKVNGSFEVKAFVEKSRCQNEGPAVAPPSTAQPEQEDSAPCDGAFRPLDDKGVRKYLSGVDKLATRLGGRSADWQVKEVGDGNINYVWAITGPTGSLCLKQAPPYVRVAESWNLSQDRIRIEAAALEEQARYANGHVPELLHFDPVLPGIAMEFVKPPAVMLRLGLNAGKIYRRLGKHMGLFLARTLFNTSLLANDSHQHRLNIERFSNDEMCGITELLIFQEPYMHSDRNTWTKHLEDDVQALRKDTEAVSAAARLKVMFTEQAQALLHGDLHTGSVLVTEDTTHVIDAEFATMGPLAFDVGKFMGNLLLAMFASDGHSTVLDPRIYQRAWLLTTVVEVWTTFRSEFINLWNDAPPQAAGFPQSLYRRLEEVGLESLEEVQEQFMDKVFAEALAFAGACLIRRMVGMAHTVDMEAIEDPRLRAVCESRALKFGRTLLVDAKKFRSIEEVVEKADLQRKDAKDPYYLSRSCFG